MRFKRFACIVASSSLIGACTLPRMELRHSGGYPGSVLDRHFFNASGSKELQLFRMTILVALASRVSVASIRDGQEAEAYIRYLQNATNEINYLAAHLYGAQSTAGARLIACRLPMERNATLVGVFNQIPAPVVPPSLPTGGAAASPVTEAAAAATVPMPADRSPLPSVPPSVNTPPAAAAAAAAAAGTPAVEPCATYEALFESEMPDLEYKVARLLLASLPQEQASELAGAIRSGNLFTVAWRLLRLAAASVDGMHRGAAVYRTAQEVLAAAVLEDAATAPRWEGCAMDLTRQPDDRRTEIERVRRPEDVRLPSVEYSSGCLGRSLLYLFDDRARANVTLPYHVRPYSFQTLFAVIYTSCRMLPRVIPEENSPAREIPDRSAACGRMVFSPQLRYGAVPAERPPENMKPKPPTTEGGQPASGTEAPGQSPPATSSAVPRPSGA